MIITLLCEPRSGSTNLANWFRANKDFTVLNEPITNNHPELSKKGIPPSEWTYETKYLLVKEILGDWENPQELLSISDKIIVLYRENEEEQIESWLHARATGNWTKQWDYQKIEDQVEANLFREVKKEFRDKYLSENYFYVSYEELYYQNGFQRVVDYLNIEGIRNVGFPYGFRYRSIEGVPRNRELI